ncbi:MAG TPA: metalloregulator ArsR/SmtB family transcription factor [Candidatus Limnocylindrales bacterium]|nr:metalloregulator ArsR/SmtB family transcription factor [Candidatus Limnocylindrales bacterium]
MLHQYPSIDPVLQALADPTRRLIVERLGEGPASVKQLAAPLPMSLAAVMQHLQVLERAGLVKSEKRGRTRVCELDVARLDTLDAWIAERKRTWERRYDRLGEILKKET